ncbi:hypothetical protein HanXRQr2_Chr06g0249491 [Helianthus annuus]|uniref:Uncharacterized protein n=1 Tax=Helianthus annuus TaxID=4232 RepID=A0A251SJH3_HELAN|nr:hypothetical protein HanXRQr2_Chr06g0249491 [Helianthus annuus]KAJ0914640.1 hypothetical protein HanPSC8_Chr06g0240851 [Helianthus annuus]
MLGIFVILLHFKSNFYYDLQEPSSFASFYPSPLHFLKTLAPTSVFFFNNTHLTPPKTFTPPNFAGVSSHLSWRPRRDDDDGRRWLCS